MAGSTESNVEAVRGRYERAIRLWLARLAAAVAVAATVTFITQGLTSARSFVTARRQYAPMTLDSREMADGASLNLAFLEWARSHLLANGRHTATFLFASSSGAATRRQSTVTENTLLYQYSMYMLAPARATATLGAAQWVVIYGQTPSSIGLQSGKWSVMPFANGYSLARRRA